MRMTTRSGAAVSANDERQDEVSAAEQAPPDQPSRRSFFFFGALAAAAMLPKGAAAQAVRRRRISPAETPSGEPLAGIQPNEMVSAFAEWDASGTRLVRRVTMGMTPRKFSGSTRWAIRATSTISSIRRASTTRLSKMQSRQSGRS